MTLDIVALTPPNEAPNRQLGFSAKTLRIDNPTAAYWYLPDQLRFIQPFASGVIVTLAGTQVANIRFQAPPGLQQPAAFPVSAAATFVYDDATSGPDSGTNLANAAFGRTVPSRVLSVPCIAGTGNAIFNDAFPVGAPDGFSLYPIGFNQLLTLYVYTALPNTFANAIHDYRTAPSIMNIESFESVGIHWPYAVPAQTTLGINLTGVVFTPFSFLLII